MFKNKIFLSNGSMIKKYFSVAETYRPEALFMNDSFVCAMKCAKQGTSLVVLSCGIEYFSEDPQEKEIFDKVQSLVRRCRISLQNICVILSLKNVLIKEVVFPKIEDQLMEEVLSLEMEKHVPLNVQDIYYDFIPLSMEKKGEDKRFILLGVLLKKIYQESVAQLKKYGIYKPFLPLKESLIGYYYMYHSSIFQKESVLLIDLTDLLNAQFYLYDQGVLKFCKNFSLNKDIFSEDVENKEVLLKNVFEEIENSILYFEGIQHSKRPIYLKIHSLKDVSDKLLKHICEVLKMKNLPLKHSIEREYSFIFAYAISFFESRQILAPRSKKKRKNILLMAFSHIVIFLSSVFLIQLAFIISSYKDFFYIKQLDKERKSFKVKEQTQEKFMNRFQHLSMHANNLLIYRKHKNLTLVLLSVLVKYLPSKTFLSSVTKNSSGEIFFKGLTKKFLEMKERLELCPFVHSLTIVSVKEIEVENEIFTVFEGNFHFGKTSWRESGGEK